MYSMKKYLLLFLCLTLGVAYAQDTLRVRVMTYNLRFGSLVFPFKRMVIVLARTGFSILR